ncbi:2Fe-2S iron-sulfur cluster-binding protein [Streptomyces sp. NPDC057002]|uniref:2Fe-2S iron-sulfur cluster-binding protein n=1 Tax=Streptomyces sp. NPDC057002 TaxID=3345992 RepID=UPI00362ED1C4
MLRQIAPDFLDREVFTRAGLNLPASCARGMCGTCKATLVSGSVDMRHNGGIRPGEIARNEILLCRSKP